MAFLFVLLFVVPSLGMHSTLLHHLTVKPCASPIPPSLPSLKQIAHSTRQRLVDVFQATPNATAGLMLLFAGSLDHREDTDTEVAFRQESNFLYATQIALPDYIVTMNTKSGFTTLFAPERDANYALWNGVVYTHAELKEMFGVDAVVGVPQLDAELRKHAPYPTPIYVLPGYAARVPNGLSADDKTLRPLLHTARVVKTDHELAYLRVASSVSAAAHARLAEDVQPGMFEYNIDAFFQYFTMNCGLTHQAYRPIVAAGNHSAILHYNTNNAKIGANDLVLVDAGAEFRGYASDITRTFPASGKWTNDQQAIANAVEQTVKTVENMIAPGVHYSTLSEKAVELVCQALHQLGYIQGDLHAAINAGVCGVFFPHGLGHSVGLDVHDPGNISVLKENMVFTIEPGIYFNRAFVNMAQSQPNKAPFLVMSKINALLDANFGGVRYEDVVLVTANGFEVLSNV